MRRGGGAGVIAAVLLLRRSPRRRPLGRALSPLSCTRSRRSTRIRAAPSAATERGRGAESAFPASAVPRLGLVHGPPHRGRRPRRPAGPATAGAQPGEPVHVRRCQPRPRCPPTFVTGNEDRAMQLHRPPAAAARRPGRRRRRRARPGRRADPHRAALRHRPDRAIGSGPSAATTTPAHQSTTAPRHDDHHARRRHRPPVVGADGGDRARGDLHAWPRRATP